MIIPNLADNFISVAQKRNRCSEHIPNIYETYLLTFSFTRWIFRWFGQESRHNILVIDMLGASLEELFLACNFRFSLKTVLMIADQCMERVQYLHSKNFIHRSIKPENFMIGRNSLCSTVIFQAYKLLYWI